MKWQKVGYKRIVRGKDLQKDGDLVSVGLLTWRNAFTHRFSSYAIILIYKGDMYETCCEFFKRADALKEIKNWTNESISEYLNERYFLKKFKVLIR